MVEKLSDKITPSGLDTLSEYALRRLTNRWTGSLHEADTLLDARSQTQVTSADTFGEIVGQWRKAREVYHDGVASEVYGEVSSLAEGATAPLSDTAAVDSLQHVDKVSIPIDEVMLSTVETAAGVGEWMPLLYQSLVVVAILYYIFCLYRYFDDILALFSSIFQRQVVTTDRNVERRRSDIFYGALGKLFMMGLFFVGLLAALVVRRESSGLSMEQLFYMPFIVVAVYGLVVCVQYLLLMAIGFVTRSVGEVAILMRIRLIYFVLATVMVAPIMLVAQMSMGDGHNVWQNLGFVATIMALVMFARESIGFFISKKVSILHWILYLCTVEIVPLTLLWQIAIRVR